MVYLVQSSVNRILLILWIMRGRCWFFPPIFCGMAIGAVETSCGWRWTGSAVLLPQEAARCAASAYYIPKTSQKNGVTLQLADVQWEPMASAAENSEVPSLFSATATYTGTGWGSKASGYLATASYSGEVTKTESGEQMISIVYEEAAAPPAESAIDWAAILLPVLGILLGAGLLAGGWFGVRWILRKRKESVREPVRNAPYMGRPPMDTPDLLAEMDRGLEEDNR